MNECGWCGKPILGEPVSPLHEGALVYFEGSHEKELLPEFHTGFCCSGCAWAFTAEREKLWGLEGKELRQHLIEEHGLASPPGKPAGNQSVISQSRLNMLREIMAWSRGMMDGEL